MSKTHHLIFDLEIAQLYPDLLRATAQAAVIGGQNKIDSVHLIIVPCSEPAEEEEVANIQSIGIQAASLIPGGCEVTVCSSREQSDQISSLVGNEILQFNPTEDIQAGSPLEPPSEATALMHQFLSEHADADRSKISVITEDHISKNDMADVFHEVGRNSDYLIFVPAAIGDWSPDQIIELGGDYLHEESSVNLMIRSALYAASGQNYFSHDCAHAEFAALLSGADVTYI